jgi:hypothetical protein
MNRVASVLAICLITGGTLVEAQRRTPPRTPPRKPAAVPKKIEPAQVVCPEPLGIGVKTKASYCFVLAGRDPAEGVLIKIPPHTGEASLIFDLHNRHTYSEEEVKAGRGFATHQAVIGALTMKGELLERGAVQSEFRTAADLYERIGGGAGPGGVKAVAPIGREEVVIPVPANVDQVSLLGEVLESRSSAGPETATPGRPVAIVSNVRIEYQPAPVKPVKRQPNAP